MDIPQDKALHFTGGALSALAVHAILPRLAPDTPRPIRIALAILPSLILGAAKEAYDARHPDEHTADINDFAATVAGGACLSLCMSFTF